MSLLQLYDIAIIFASRGATTNGHCTPGIPWCGSNIPGKMQNSDTEKQYQWIGLREKFNRKAHYLMGISMVSCRFSLKPTD